MPGGTDPSAFASNASGGGMMGGAPRHGMGEGTPSNVLLVSVEDHLYQLTIPVMHHVFSAYGNVVKIALFEKKGGFQSLIQMVSVEDATKCKQALDGHQVDTALVAAALLTTNSNPAPPCTYDCLPPCELTVLATTSVCVRPLPHGGVVLFPPPSIHPSIASYLINPCRHPSLSQVYEGCCRLRMSYSTHTNLNVRKNTDATWDYTGLFQSDAGGAPGDLMAPGAMAGSGVAGLAPIAVSISSDVFQRQTRTLPPNYQQDPR